MNQYSDEIRAVMQAVASEAATAWSNMDEPYCAFCVPLEGRRHEPDCIVIVARNVCDALGLEYGEEALDHHPDDVSPSGNPVLTAYRRWLRCCLEVNPGTKLGESISDLDAFAAGYQAREMAEKM